MSLTPSQLARKRYDFNDIEHPNAKVPRSGHMEALSDDILKTAAAMAFLGATDAEMAEFFNVSPQKIVYWRITHPEFRNACMLFGEDANNRVKRALYTRAVEGDLKAQDLWLKNRDKANWGEGSAADTQVNVLLNAPTDRAAALAVFNMLMDGAKEPVTIEGEVEDV